MMKQIGPAISSLFLVTSLMISIEAQYCRPSGTALGRAPPPGQCNDENNSECCIQDKPYNTYRCSPPVSSSTRAILTLNSFEQGGDGGAESACDNQFHSNNAHVVALSTGWFNNGRRCFNHINIYGNGNTVRAKVVDECDSTVGCDSEHDYQPPCRNHIVDASRAVWEALGVPRDQWGDNMPISWSDAN